MKVWLYAASNSAEFVHDLRYSLTWEYEWISKVFWGDKKLGFVGAIKGFRTVKKTVLSNL